MKASIQKYPFVYLYFLIVAGTALVCVTPSFRQEPSALHAFWLSAGCLVAAGFFFVLYQRDLVTEYAHLTENQFGELFIWMIVGSGLFFLFGICQACHTFVGKYLFH